MFIRQFTVSNSSSLRSNSFKHDLSGQNDLDLMEKDLTQINYVTKNMTDLNKQKSDLKKTTNMTKAESQFSHHISHFVIFDSIFYLLLKIFFHKKLNIWPNFISISFKLICYNNFNFYKL